MIDYKKLGFKCGIEIHQQLEGKKLFCNCPTIIRKDNSNFNIIRYLKASASEHGNVDKAAKYEQDKKKYYVYNGYTDINCLVETDEEPPRNINQEALSSALQICKLLNAKIPDQIIFMRKVVVDGSNVSGFQRTALIGMDGYLEIEGKKINISTICLEEEACQVIERNENFDVYNLSRQGIPLLEIATAPDISSSDECKVVASKIGMLLRSLNNCKRGIGSIRQDVNISIEGAQRIEIKGFQDLRSIPKVIDNEINRQLSLLNKKEKVTSHVRKAESDFSTSYLRPMPGADRMYPETDVMHIIPNLEIADIETIEDKINKYKTKYILNDDYATLVVKNKDFVFSKIFDKFKNLDPKLIVNILLKLPNDLKKRHNANVDIKKHYEFLLENLNNEKINFSSVEEILLKLSKNEKVDISKYESMPLEKVESEIKEIISNNKNASIGALMGKCMQHFKGRVDGKTVNKILTKNLK